MPAPKPSITRAEFDVLAARTGLPLDEAQKSECYAVFGYLEEIAARVRVDGNRPREAEPALIFHAGRRKGGARLPFQRSPVPPRTSPRGTSRRLR